MPNSREDAEVFLSSIQYSLEQFFATFESQQETLAEIKNELDEIDRLRQIHRDVFIDRDQWSPHANHYYRQYMERIQALDARKEKLGLDNQSQIETALTQIGATEEAMAVIAGAILQLAKQVLSFRFGPKDGLPASRYVGSRAVTELIWEGRNHAMHWEENSPYPPVVTMFDALNVDHSLSYLPNRNNAWTILGAIGWKTAQEAIDELTLLIQ